MSTQLTGDQGELLVIQELSKLGYEIFRPMFGNSSCDLIALKDGKAKRVEVKTTTHKAKAAGKYVVRLKKTRINTQGAITLNFDASAADLLCCVILPTSRVYIFDAKLYDGRNSVQLAE